MRDPETIMDAERAEARDAYRRDVLPGDARVQRNPYTGELHDKPTRREAEEDE